VKEETTNNKLQAMDVGALTTLGTVALTDRMVINLDQLAPYDKLLRMSGLKDGAVGVVG
jgi:hypothetical protein